MTIEERAKASEAAVSSLTAERDDLRKTVEASFAGAGVELESARVELAFKESLVAELTAKLEAVTAQVSVLEASAMSASKSAANILAASGVEPVRAPSNDVTAVVSIKEQYAAMSKGPERSAFYAKHKAVLFSSK